MRVAIHSLHKVNSRIHSMSGSYRFQVQIEITEAMSLFIPLKKGKAGIGVTGGKEQHGANNASHSHQLPWLAFNMEIGNGISSPPFSLDLHVNEVSG